MKEKLIELFTKVGNETDAFAPFVTCDQFENLADEIVKLCNLHIVMRCACCGNTTKFSDGAKQQILIEEEYRYIYAVTCDECGKVCNVELFD